jgi:hypothetical protein
MHNIEIMIGEERFVGCLQEEDAPETCARFRALLPWKQKLIHVRWSGEGCWIPLGDMELGIGSENATSYPRPGQMIFYTGGVSEAEILLAYGAVNFASKAGHLAGNAFLVIKDGLDRLEKVGRQTLWEGALDISFREIA